MTNGAISPTAHQWPASAATGATAYRSASVINCSQCVARREHKPRMLWDPNGGPVTALSEWGVPLELLARVSKWSTQ